MNLISPPPVSRGGDRPPEDIDRTLRAFFKAEMPEPWPSLEAPAPRRPATIPFAPPPARRGSLLRSRLALAASVALLAMGLAVLAGAFQGKPTASGPSVVNPNARKLPGPGDAPVIPVPREQRQPSKLKVNETLIQEPNGTTIKVDVIDWPVPPK
jgi:hypothetical protein